MSNYQIINGDLRIGVEPDGKVWISLTDGMDGEIWAEHADSIAEALAACERWIRIEVFEEEVA